MSGGGFPTWLVGVIINVLGSMSINLGTNLMKLSHNDKELLARLQAQENRRKVRLCGSNICTVPRSRGDGSTSVMQTVSISMLLLLGSVAHYLSHQTGAAGCAERAAS
jgi:hypothetical protein